MASSYTGLGTELMTTGENAGTWGTTTNTNLQIIEQMVGGYTAQSIAGSADTTTLSVSDGSAGAVLAHRIIEFTGTITGNQIVTIPLDVQQMYIVKNNTSGAYTVQFKYASGSGSSVTWAATDKGTKLLYATADDGTNPNLVDSNIGGVGTYDLDGGELTLDADSDTSITASTDDQIDFEIAGADDFTMTANAFNVLTGSHVTFADSANAKFGTGNDMLMYHDGSNSYITNAVGALKVATETSGIAVTIGHTTSEVTVADNLTVTGTLTGTLATAAQGSVTSLGTLSTLTVDNVIVNGTTIGHTDDTDLITLADGVATVAGEISVTTLDIGGTNVTATAAEINLIDGGTARGTTAVADGDGVLVNDAGTMRMTNVTALKTYFTSGVSSAADDISVGDAAVTIGNGSTSADITIDSGDDVVIDAAGGNVEFKDAGTLQLSLDMDGTAGVQIIKLGVDSDDLVFQQYDGNEVMRINDNRKVCFYDDGGEHISSDGTDFTFASGNDINLTATTDINIPSDVGLTFGNDGEKIEGDGTDLTIAGNNINLTAVADVVIPANVGITFGSGEKIEGDSTDLTVTSGGALNLTATTDVVIPANVGITFGSGEKIEGDSTDLTITSGAKINLTATSDVVIPANVGITFGTGEKIEGDSTDLTVTSGAKINLTATSDVHLPNSVGMVFGDAGEKIEGDGTDLTISSSALATIDAGTDITLDADGGDIFFKDNGTTFGSATNTSGNLIIKSGTTTALTFSGANATFAGTLATAAGGLNIAGLDIDGGTDIGADIADADLFIIDDGAGGTNRKVAASRIKTYVGGGTSWQAIKTGAYTASAGQGVFANTTSSAFTVTLPSSPTLGDEVTIVDYAGTFDSNNLTVGRNSQPIMGVAENMTVATERAAFTLVYVDGTQGWIFKDA